MAIHAEPRRTGEHVLSEANGNLSRDEVPVLAGGLVAETELAGGLVAGTVLAKNTSGVYVILAPEGSNGTNVAAAVLYADAVNTSDDPTEPTTAVVHNWGCEVAAADLTWPDGITAQQKATAITNLRAVGIKVR